MGADRVVLAYLGKDVVPEMPPLGVCGLKSSRDLSPVSL